MMGMAKGDGDPGISKGFQNVEKLGSSHGQSVVTHQLEAWGL